MKKCRLPAWVIVDIILVAAAIVFRFAMLGYDFIAYTLLFLAAVIACYRFFGKTLKIILTILLTAGLIYFIIVEVPVVKNALTDPQPQSNYVIVLGAGVNGTSPSLSLLNRLDTAYEYLEKYPEATAIVTGGKGSGEDITEAQCMYDWLTAKGISPERIITEDEATSTSENFANSFAIIRSRGDDPADGVAVISSEYHLYRAKLLAQQSGVDVKTVAAKTTYPVIRLNYFIREAFAITYMRIK